MPAENVNGTVAVPVAGADIVIDEEELIAVIVVAGGPPGIPDPETIIPTASPAVDDKPSMVVLLLVCPESVVTVPEITAMPLPKSSPVILLKGSLPPPRNNEYKTVVPVGLILVANAS